MKINIKEKYLKPTQRQSTGSQQRLERIRRKWLFLLPKPLRSPYRLRDMTIEEARSFWWFLFHSRFTKLDYTLLPTILTEYSMGTAKASRFCGNVSSYSQDSVWSWFICLCSSICMMLTLGFSFALGVLFPVLMNSFNENRERTGKINHFITYFRR